MSSRDYVSIGSTPSDEDCAQVGDDDYRSRASRETRAFVSQLRRIHGPEPQGAQLRGKWSAHDFGSYVEVVCYYDESFPESMTYALLCESDTPSRWDALALAELAITLVKV